MWYSVAMRDQRCSSTTERSALACSDCSGDARPSTLPWSGRIAALAGTCGSIACSVAMIVPLVGAVGAGAASGAAGMAGMGGSGASSGAHHTGLEEFLLRFGPEILVVSVVLVTASLATRRTLAGLVALGAGGLLYWGMYGQSSTALMYAAISVAYALWATVYWWAQSNRGAHLRRDS